MANAWQNAPVVAGNAWQSAPVVGNDAAPIDPIRHPLDTSSLTPDSPAVPWYTPVTDFLPNAWHGAQGAAQGAYNQAGHLFDTVPTPIGPMPLGPMGPVVSNMKDIYGLAKGIAQDPNAAYNAATQMLSDKLGTPTRAWNTIATHPFDAALAFSPGLGMVAKGADAMGMVRAADALGTAAEYSNPVNLVAKPVAAYGPGVAKTVAAPAYGYFNPTDMADTIFNKAIARSGQTPAELAASLRAAITEGQPGFTTADAMGQRGQELLASVARSPNDMQQTIAETLANRQAGQASRVGDFVKTGLGADGTSQKMASGLTGLRKMVADSLYTASRADGGPVDLSGAINKIDELVGPTTKYDVGISPDSTEGALRSLRNQLASGTAKDGITSRSDFGRILSQKGDLRDKIASLYDSGKGEQAGALKQVYNQLDAALADASPSYRAANSTFSQMSRPIEAVDTGAQGARGSTRAADSVSAYQAMTKDPVSQMSYKSGYADPLLARLENSPISSNAVRPLLSDKYATEFGAMAKDPALLARQLARENTMNATMQRALGGSKTDMNLINDAGMSAVSPTDLAHAILSGPSGLLRLGIRGGANFLTGKNSAVRSLLAKKLLGNTLPVRNASTRIPFNDKEWIKALLAGRAATASMATPAQ